MVFYVRDPGAPLACQGLRVKEGLRPGGYGILLARKISIRNAHVTTAPNSDIPRKNQKTSPQRRHRDTQKRHNGYAVGAHSNKACSFPKSFIAARLLEKFPFWTTVDSCCVIFSVSLRLCGSRRLDRIFSHFSDLGGKNLASEQISLCVRADVGRVKERLQPPFRCTWANPCPESRNDRFLG